MFYFSFLFVRLSDILDSGGWGVGLLLLKVGVHTGIEKGYEYPRALMLIGVPMNDKAP